MKYKGKLYAKIGGKYLEISHTDKFEQLEIEANYSDMLIKELDSLKKENEIQQEHLMLNEAELIPLREQFKRVQGNLIDKEEVNAELRQTIIAKQQREIRLENILAPHQELTQWIEEEMTCEPNSNKFEVSHDFLEQLFYKVVHINH